MAKPVIALVGRPNVGKSTLFNMLTKTRDALVADFPGLTRDRKYGHASIDGQGYVVIDTGGLSGEEEGIDEPMAQQTLLAIEEANIILFIVDAHDGLTAADEGIASLLRATGKTIHVVVNKLDGISEDQVRIEFFGFGFTEPMAISAVHNRGVTTMIQQVIEHEGDILEEVDDPEQGIKVAMVGRPNVGKSTLINRILGEERVVAFDEPGTTRDSIFVPFERDDRKYTLIDTAGIRRRKNVKVTVEKFSVIKTLQSIDTSHVAVLVIDAREGIADQDLHLLSYIISSGRALVIAINKWDGLDQETRDGIKDELERRLTFIDFADILFISALHGTNVGHLYEAINLAYDSARRDLSTPELTRILEEALEAHQPPLVRGRRVKLRYAHQGGKNPPIIVIHGNISSDLPDAYRRYLINKFRAALNLKGTPVKIEFKAGANPFEGRVNKLTTRQVSKKRRLMSFVKKNKKRKQRKRSDPGY